MAIALVQTKKQNGGGYANSYTVALTGSVVAGNTLILGLTAGDSNTIASITDNRGNTWTLAASKANSAGGERKSWLYYAQNVAAGSTTITITFGSGEFADSVVIVREYSGLAASSVLDKTASSDSGSSYDNSHSSGATATTAQANELVIGLVGSSGSSSPTFTAGSGYGNITEQAGSDPFTYEAMEDKIVSSAGAQTATFGSTGFVRSETIVATFKEAAASTANPSALSSALAILAPVVSGAAIATAATLSGAFGIQAPVARGAAQISPAVINRTLAVQSPTPQGAAQTSPSNLSASLAIQNPTAGSSGVVSPNTVNSSIAILAPTVTGSAIVSPNPVNANFAVQTPTISAPTNVYPAQINGSFSVLTPQIQAGASLNVIVLFGIITPQILTVSGGAWTKVIRSADDSYNQISRATDASYNTVSRTSDDSWNQINRP